jgi:hypothetical protein
MEEASGDDTISLFPTRLADEFVPPFAIGNIPLT